MPSFTLPNTPFPEGTTVSAYDAQGYQTFPAGGPPGTPVATATVASGTLTFTGLANHHGYFAAAQVGGSWRSRRFSVGENGPPPRIEDIDFSTLGPLKLLAVNASEDGYEYVDAAPISVDQLGADPTGEADSYDAFQSAIEEAQATGGEIVATHGATYLLDKSGSTGLKLARDNAGTGGKVRISGAGAKIKLSAHTPRFLDFDKKADGDTFQNIEVSDLTIDANNIGGLHHVILGTFQNGAVQTRINLKNIALRRIRVINALTSAETGTNHRLNVHLAVNDTVAEGTRYTIYNVKVEDLELNGGNEGVFVGGGGITTVGLNVFVDEVHVRNVIHDMGAAKESNFASAHVQIGSRATGGRCTITDCYGRGSGDIGFEIDSMMEMVVTRCRVRDSFGAGFFATNFNYPTLSDSAPTATMAGQRQIFDTCKAFRVSSTTGRGFRTDYNLSVPLGTVIVRNCAWQRTQTVFSLSGGVGEALLFNHTGKEARIEGFDCAVEGISVAEGAGASAATLMSVQNGTLELLRVRNVTMRFTGTNASVSSQTLRGLELGGSGGALIATVDIDGLAWVPTLSGWVGGTYGLIVGFTGTATLRGSIRGFRYPSSSGLTSASDGILFGGTSSLTISANSTLLLADCDFAKMSAGTEIVFESTSVASKVIYGPGMIWRVWPATAAAANELTVRAGFNLITGKTEIKKIVAMGPGTEAILKFAEEVKIADGENLKLASTFEANADDTLRLVCDGTNWYEVGRSAN